MRAGQFGCEIWNSRNSFVFSVHHPLGRDEVYRNDPRNGIFLCNECHERYDHNLPLLIEEMGYKSHGQVLWLHFHKKRVYPMAKMLIDRKLEKELLSKSWAAIQSGAKTREDVRDWTAPNILELSQEQTDGRK